MTDLTVDIFLLCFQRFSARQSNCPRCSPVIHHICKQEHYLEIFVGESAMEKMML